MQQKIFNTETLDIEKFVKVNNLKPIINPIYFVSNGIPTPDGLLSNDIFGISKNERANIFAYIDLHKTFIDPLCYKLWSRMDKKIKECVHGIKLFKIDIHGQLIEDENGEAGIEFLKKNIQKIKIRHSDSMKRDDNIEFIEKAIKENTLFITKLNIIPAYYRDVKSSTKKTGVGEINKLYNSVLIAVQAFKETEDFGFSLNNLNIGRVQEKIVDIYNWFTKEPNIGKKNGILRRSVLAKTSDYSCRLVLSSAELKVEAVDDLMVDVSHCALPLSAALANLFPYILHWCRRFFENEFGGVNEKVLYDKEGNAKIVHVKNPYIQFSDEVIKKYMKRFIHGYSNRFIPIEVELTTGEKRFMYFKGTNTPLEEKRGDLKDTSSIYNRRLTWCDLFYMAAVESAKDKHVLITRYPIDTYYGQFPNKINIASTKETMQVYINNEFYPYYPKITEADIGSNTSNIFKDTLCISNLNIGPIGADFEILISILESAWGCAPNQKLS